MISRRSTLAGLGGLAAAGIAGSTSAGEVGAAIDAILTARAGSEHVPGYAFLAVRDGKVVHAIASGLRDRDHDLPVTLDTLFPIGSCTKAFTAMATGVFQDRGLLSLDERPHRFLPYFKMFDADADTRVTLRDMLSHRTGLLAKADLAAEPGVLTREDYVRAATSARPAFPFRTTFQYSNAMVCAVGELLGHIGGASWEEVVTQEVLRPLGMATARATLLGLGNTPDHATGYVYDPATSAWQATPPPASLDALAPAGAIAASANDMAKWLMALTHGGYPLVRPRTLGQITARQININDQLAYALGWVTYGWNGMKVVEHNGGSEGICALTSFIPEARTGFVFLGNTSPNFLTKVGNLGPLIYPLLLGVAAPRDVPAPAARAPVISLPPVAKDDDPPPLPNIDLDTLLARMVTATGGEEVLARHTAMIATGDRSYENQGVQADYTLKAAAPASHEEVEMWNAVGRDIGQLRVYFDGAKGGQETTFGQEALNDSAGNAVARRDYDFRPVLHLRDLYKTVAITGTRWTGDKATLVVTLTGDEGSSVELGIGMDNYLIARRFEGGEETLYSDYRPVDGEQVAHTWITHGALGLVSTNWREVAFGDGIAPSAFAAKP